MDDIKDGCKLSGLWLAVIVCLVVIGIGTIIAEFVIQRNLINPQVRQNMTLDPAKTIADGQDFHNKLSEIISADQNVIIYLNQIEICEKTAPPCNNDDTLQNNLAGVEQIRNSTINAYNTKAVNPDDNKYLELWMPKKIDVTVIPAGYEDARAMLQNEVNNLQAIYDKGV